MCLLFRALLCPLLTHASGRIFIVECPPATGDGKEIGREPEKVVARFGRPLFQRKTHRDTAEAPLAEMLFWDKARAAGAKPLNRVMSVNRVALKPAAAEVKL
jgi:hypothetical protein